MKANPFMILLISTLLVFSSPKSRDYERHLELSLLFYEAQRSGKLPETNRIYWRHDSMLDAGYDYNLDLSGGYYDAGDNCKFNFPGAGALTLIAWSGIDFKEGYERANQYENMLDMVKWGTDFFIKCHPDKYTFFIQVGNGNIDHGFWYPPEYINYAYPSYKVDKDHPGSEVTGEVAATLAAASILFKDENSAYSQTLLKHAIELYEFADEYRGDYTSSVPEVKDFYGTQPDGYFDELEWASLWLFRATGEQKYIEKFENFIASDKYYGDWDKPINWEDKYGGVFVLAAQLLNEDKHIDRARKFCQAILDNQRTPGGLYFYPSLSRWGSNRHAANAGVNLLFFANTLPKSDSKRQAYVDFAESQMNYILGDNPLGINFVVGAEKNSPKSVHHRAASFTYDTSGFPEENVFTLWGALAGGPGINDDYEDDRSNYEKNEVAIDYNAGFTGLLAGLIQFGLGRRDPYSMVQFDRSWPKLAPTPDVTVKFVKNGISVATGSGLTCGSFCVTFKTNTTMLKLSINAHGINTKGPTYTICNGLENGYLDGKGTPQVLKFRLEDNVYFERSEEFEVLCDGFHAPRKPQDPQYKPELGHSFKVTKEGGPSGTTPLYEQSMCWPKHICE